MLACSPDEAEEAAETPTPRPPPPAMSIAHDVDDADDSTTAAEAGPRAFEGQGNRLEGNRAATSGRPPVSPTRISRASTDHAGKAL